MKRLLCTMISLILALSISSYYQNVMPEKHLVYAATSVTTGPAMNILATGATLNGNLTSLGDASAAGIAFQWGTVSGNYTHQTALQGIAAVGAFSACLTGLTPDTTYYYRACEGIPDTAYGNEMSFTTSSLNTAPVVLWNQTFGSTGDDYGQSVIQASDGGYVIVGSTSSSGAGGYDVWLIKTNSEGTELWDKTFGGTEDDYGQSVIQAADGGYVIAGSTVSYATGAPDYEVWLIKTNSQGDEIWNKTFSGASYYTYGGTFGNCVIQSSDGGYAIISSNAAASGSVWLIKTDSNGNKLWDKTFRFDYSLVDYLGGRSVVQTADGSYVIAGFRAQEPPGYNANILLIKTDSSGNLLWNKTIASTDMAAPSIDSGASVIQANDGGYIIAGSSNSMAGYNADIWLIKTDGNGNDEWDKTFDSGENYDDVGYSVFKDTDGGYAVAGTGGPGAILLKTDNSGNEIWDKTFSGAAYEVIQAADEGYVCTGSTSNRDVFLMKVGNIVPATKLVFITQPSDATVAASFTTQPIVGIQDDYGNIVTNNTSAVTLDITPGTGAAGAVLSGVNNVSAVGGIATFNGLSIDKAGTGYTLTASSNGLTSAISSPFAVSPVTLYKLAFTTQPGNGTGGSAFTTQPVVTVQDNYGNTVTSSSAPITIAIGSNSASGTLSGTTTVNAVHGVASFNGLSINSAGAGYTLTATSNGLSSAISNSFTIGVGPPSKLGFIIQPSGAIAGVAFTNQPQIAIKDLGGNTVTSNTSAVTLAITPSTGTAGAVLSGVNNVSAVGGIATFIGLSINLAGSNYTLTANSNSLDSAVSDFFTVLNPIAPSGGGGGGGGGGVGRSIEQMYPSGFSSKTPMEINRSGIIQAAATLTTQDNQVTLDIAANTRLMSKEGNALSIITVENVAYFPTPPSGNVLVMVYTFGPDGATFDPPMILTMAYDPTKLPVDVNEKDLYISYIDGTQWQTLESTVDTQAQTVTTKISHFSTYALLGEISSPETPSPTPNPSLTTTPTPTPTASVAAASIPAISPTPTGQPNPIMTQTPFSTQTSTPSQQASSSFNFMILIGSLAAIVIILMVLMVTLKRRSGKKGKPQ